MIHQLLVVGEAVKRLSEEFREQHPNLPWRLMAGMRDKLIHEYDEVDIEEVWRTVQNDLPELLATVEPLIPSKPS